MAAMSLPPELVEIQAAMSAKSFTRSDAARILGLDTSQVTRTFQGTRRLQLHEARKLREWLGLEPTSASVVTPGGVALMPGLIPLFGFVGASSPTRLTLTEDHMLGAVPMRPAQQHVKQPFALQVLDESMSPRYEPGEIVYLAPNRWPVRGQYLVLETTDGVGHLKQLLRRETDRTILHQLNPSQDLEIANDHIRAVHTVIGSGSA